MSERPQLTPFGVEEQQLQAPPKGLSSFFKAEPEHPTMEAQVLYQEILFFQS